MSGEKTVENNYLANFHWQEGMQPPRITMIKYTYQFRLKKYVKLSILNHFVAYQMQNFLRQGDVQSLKIII